MLAAPNGPPVGQPREVASTVRQSTAPTSQLIAAEVRADELRDNGDASRRFIGGARWCGCRREDDARPRSEAMLIRSRPLKYYFRALPAIAAPLSLARVLAPTFAMRRFRSILAATILTLVIGAAAASDVVGARTALDLAGVVARDDAVDPESTASERFVPPAPDDPAQVVQLDANALFAALVNHTVRRAHSSPFPRSRDDDAMSPRACHPDGTPSLPLPQVVVAFTVKWCALCRGYEPEFAKVASAFAGAEDPRSRTPLVFGAVDVDVGDNRRLAKTLGVQSAPFVAALRHKRWYVVTEGRTVIRPPRRYEGYLGASPTAAWVTSLTGARPIDATRADSVRPYVENLDDGSVGVRLRSEQRRPRRILRPLVRPLSPVRTLLLRGWRALREQP